MGHVVARGRGMWIQGHHLISVWPTAANLVPMKPDFERPQVNSFELDRRRRDGQRLIRAVKRPIAKLLAQRREVPVDLRCRGNAIDSRCGRKLMVEIFQLRATRATRIAQIVSAIRGREIPTPLAGITDLANEILTALPGTTREFGR